MYEESHKCFQIKFFNLLQEKLSSEETVFLTLRKIESNIHKTLSVQYFP